jgi:hypothetical protein
MPLVAPAEISLLHILHTKRNELVFTSDQNDALFRGRRHLERESVVLLEME